jgi:diketogulonate reductase-like aldo/keto reductase
MDIDRTVTLNNGVKIPILGLGVWKMAEGEETEDAVKWALESGYRHIDTAQFYGNEKSVGKAIRESGINRCDIFVTTKLEIGRFGYQNALEAFADSFEKLDLGYVDLFLLHFPVEKLMLESWRALEEILKSERVKAIGVSNFTVDHLSELIDNFEIVPVVNQVEFSPYLYQRELHEFCINSAIQLEAYSPLTQGKMLKDPKLVEIAQRYSKSTAQVLIRWFLQHDIVVIPKSSNKERIKQNGDVFDFEISIEDMKSLDGFNLNMRNSWNPENKKMVKLFSNGVLRNLSRKVHR